MSAFGPRLAGRGRFVLGVDHRHGLAVAVVPGQVRFDRGRCGRDRGSVSGRIRAGSGAHSGAAAAGDRSSGGGHQEILENTVHMSRTKPRTTTVPDAVLDGPMLGDQLRQLQCPVVALVHSRSRRGRFGTKWWAV
jgi:hypothetical protein